MELTPNINIHESSWIELRVWLLDRLKLTLDQLKSDHTEEETWKLRGSIKEIEAILRLEQKVIQRNQQA